MTNQVGHCNHNVVPTCGERPQVTTASFTIPAMENKNKRDQELEEIVTCAICTSRMEEPKHLKCQHAFCAGCLRGWVSTPPNVTSASISCPTCRALTELPIGGVACLPADFNKKALLDMLSMTDTNEDASTELDSEIVCAMCQINGDVISGSKASYFCEQCDEYICSKCIEDHNSEPALAPHPVRQVDQYENHSMTCSMHKNKKLDFFCPKCEVLVCTICIRTKHRGHDAQSIEFAAADRKTSLEGHLGEIERRLSELGDNGPGQNEQNADTNCANVERLITRHANVAKQAIDSWYTRLMQEIEERKLALQNDVSTRKEHITKLKSLCVDCEDIIFEENPRRVISTHADIESQVTNLLRHEFKQVPQLVFKPVPWPSNLGRLECDVETSETYCEETEDSSGNGAPPQRDIEFETSMGSEDELPAEASGPAKPTFTSTPAIPHTAATAATDDVVVEVLHIWKGHGNDPGRLNGPDDVVIGPGPDVWLLVAERSKRRVQRLWFKDDTRKPEDVLAGFQPGRIAMANDGSVAVTDPYHGIVHMLLVNVRDHSISKRPKWTPTRMIQPWGVAFSQDCRHIALSDMHNHVVAVYNDSLHHVLTIDGQWFATPGYLCFDPGNKLFVSDFTRNTVQAFNVDGKFLLEIDCGHGGSGDKVAPRGVATDSSGNILVATRDGVKVFSPDGQWWCNLTNGSERLREPRGLAVSRKNDTWFIAISDWTGLDYSSVHLWRL